MPAYIGPLISVTNSLFSCEWLWLKFERTTKEQKRRRIRIRRPLALYPPRGTWPKFSRKLVVHRSPAEASRVAGGDDSRSCRTVANHTVISRAERLGARSARHRNRRREEGGRRRSRRSRDCNGKLVTALTVAATVGGQVIVNQAAIGRSRNARSSSATQL